MSSWTSVGIPEDTEQENSNNALILESVVRVTLAGLAGACIGLSHSNKAAGSKIFQRAVVAAGNKKRPPGTFPRIKTVQPSNDTNYSLMYATSFMAFVSILETCRFWSPATLILEGYQSEEENSHQFTVPGGQKSVATLLDFTLGGTMAGLAGGLSKQRPPPISSSTSPLQLPSSILKTGRRSLLLSGIGTGLALGFLAGVFQAGCDVAEVRLREEEARQQALEAEREQELILREEAAFSEENPTEEDFARGEWNSQIKAYVPPK